MTNYKKAIIEIKKIVPGTEPNTTNIYFIGDRDEVLKYIHIVDQKFPDQFSRIGSQIDTFEEITYGYNLAENIYTVDGKNTRILAKPGMVIICNDNHEEKIYDKYTINFIHDERSIVINHTINGGIISTCDIRSDKSGGVSINPPDYSVLKDLFADRADSLVSNGETYYNDIAKAVVNIITSHNHKPTGDKEHYFIYEINM